jgi:membrane protease YdiL (CAAX protease family)
MMNSQEQQQPTLLHLFFVLAITFLLVIFTELLWWESQSKLKLLVLESMVLVPMLIYVLGRGYSFRDTFRWHKVKFRVLFISAVIGLGLTAVMDELDHLIQSVAPMQTEIVEAMVDLLTFHNAGEFFVIFLATVVIAGIGEEMLFRGFFQGTMERITSAKKAVIATAMVFAILHFNPWYFLEITIFGIIMGVVVWKSGSIFPAMVIHGLKNFLSLITSNVKPESISWYLFKGHVHPAWLVLGLGMVVFGLWFFDKFTGEKKVI